MIRVTNVLSGELLRMLLPELSQVFPVALRHMLSLQFEVDAFFDDDAPEVFFPHLLEKNLLVR